MWPIGSSSCSQNLNSKAFGNLVKNNYKKKKKKKENQYKLNKAMAVAIGLNIPFASLDSLPQIRVSKVFHRGQLVKASKPKQT